MQERASGLDLGWDRSPFDGEDCGLGVIDLGTCLPLDFPFGLDPFPFPFFRSFILLGLPLTVIPIFFFIRPGGLSPLYTLCAGLDWTSALRGRMAGRAADHTVSMDGTWKNCVLVSNLLASNSHHVLDAIWIFRLMKRFATRILWSQRGLHGQGTRLRHVLVQIHLT